MRAVKRWAERTVGVERVEMVAVVMAAQVVVSTTAETRWRSDPAWRWRDIRTDSRRCETRKKMNG